jgi:putative ABC transport system permease protein
MGRHLRSALRTLVHRPALSVTVIVTLALGIGANSAIFSAVDAVLLKPLPYPNADRLVMVHELNLRDGGERRATQLVAPGRLEEWNAQNRTFDGLAASYFENMSDTSGAVPERVEAMRTSPRFFSVLGVAAETGRTFSFDEERFGGPAVVVIGDAFWQKRYGRDPSSIGRRLVLAGTGCTIIGVMPPSFRYPTATTEVWMPTQAPRFFLEARMARLYTAFGRMKPGVTIEQARADLDAVEARLGDLFPQTDRGWGASLAPMKEESVRGVRRSLWFLLGAVALVLLAACGNVACLLIADATRREHEIAVRFALGADRRAVITQLLAEGALLAAAGTCAGLLLAFWGVSALRTAATQLPRISDLTIDARLVALTLALGIATTLLFALAPAVQATRRDPADALSRGGRGQVSGRHLLQWTLVAAQVALAIVLLVGAGLLTRSFARTQQVSPGLEVDHVLTFRMSANWSERLDAVVQRQARTINRLNAIPGVESSAFSQQLPLGIVIPPGEFHIVGRDPAERTFATGRSVSSGYFRTLRIPILQGETCSGDPAAPLFAGALVTRAFADRFFPGESPIGHAFTSQGMPPDRQTRIIGVVADVRENGLLKDPEPLIYYCSFNPYWPDPFFIVRTAGAHPATVNDMRSAMRDIEPGRAVYSVRPLADVLVESTSQQRINTLLLAAFAVTALTLASMGLYGVLSQLVAGRQREIGVRMALGARPIQIVTSVIAQAATATGLGIAAGLAGAFALAGFMATLLFGITIHDPLTFAVVPIVLALVATATSLVPARRAARLDPVHALRAE